MPRHCEVLRRYLEAKAKNMQKPINATAPNNTATYCLGVPPEVFVDSLLYL